MNNQDVEFWNNFYKNKAATDTPSPFATFCSDKFMPNLGNMLELGTGNGRDAFYFNKLGFKITALDLSEVAIQINKNKAEELNLNDSLIFKCFDFTKLSDLNDQKFDFIYSRFTLHSIQAEEQNSVLRDAKELLKEDGKFLIEVRTTLDPLCGKGENVAENAYRTDHFRRFIESKTFLTNAMELGWRVTYFHESNGLAVYKDEDPVVGRFVLEHKK